MPLVSLPCTDCGAALPISEGSIIQCFSCGINNEYSESFEYLTQFVFEIFNITKGIEDIEEKITDNVLNERMMVIDRIFNEYLSQSRQIEYVVVTKRDEIEFKIDIHDLGKKIGMLGLIIDNYLIRHIKNDLQVKQYSEMKTLCEIRNALLTSLWMTYEAKKSYKVKEAQEWYKKSQSNFTRAKTIALEYGEKSTIGFEDEKIIAEAGERFTELLYDFLTNNPGYFADELEEIETILKDLTDVRAIFFKKQIIEFYTLGTALMFLMGEIRERKPFEKLNIKFERILFYTQEIKEHFITAKTWLLELDEKFRDYQKKLMELHCGIRIGYLDDYRKEFEKRQLETTNQFNDSISQYVSATLSDYSIEISDDFDLLDVLMDDDGFDKELLMDKFEKERFEIAALSSTVKDFLFDFLKISINENLTQTYNLEIITAISEKNAEFDKKILRFIRILIQRFVDTRNQEKLTIEEQSKLFYDEYFSLIKRAVEESYTLELKEIPLPIFMELIILSTSLDVEVDYRVVLLLENPSLVNLRNVGVTFFVPNSFRIKTRILEIGKLKPNQKLNIDTNFIPTTQGRFNLMAMVNYEHFNDSFWMPSIKIPLIVGNPKPEDEILHNLYIKYGIDPKTVEMAKNLENEDQEELSEEERIENKLNKKFKDRIKLPKDTIEREKMISLLKELDDMEDALDLEEEEEE
jgi:hypothetical protein